MAITVIAMLGFVLRRSPIITRIERYVVSVTGITMANTLATKLTTNIQWTNAIPLAPTTLEDAGSFSSAINLPDGTGSGQVRVLWHDQRTVASGANDDLVLSALVSSILGTNVAIAFAAIKLLMIVNLNTVAGDDLLVGGAATHEWYAPFGASGNKVKCPAGMPLPLGEAFSGLTVSSGSADQLRIHNSRSNPITYNIAIAGV